LQNVIQTGLALIAPNNVFVAVAGGKISSHP